MAKDRQKIGILGEFMVASRLVELGFITAPTLKNTARIDLLVSDGVSAKMVQVKATENKKNDWGCDLPKSPNKNLVYIFVKLNTTTSRIPEFYIVPSADVTKIIAKIDEEYQKQYMAKHGCPYNPDGTKKGFSHFSDRYVPLEKYKDNWNLLRK